MSQEQIAHIANQLLAKIGSGAEPDEIAVLFSTDVQLEIRVTSGPCLGSDEV